MIATLETDVTVDAFIGGRIEAVQRYDGSHRSGLEAVLLSSAVEDSFSGTVVDLGAGTGVAGMCVAARARSASVVLVDRDERSIASARSALARSTNGGFASRVSVVAADVTSPEADRVAAGLGRAFADAVIVNPPFGDARNGTRSPVAARAEAHMLSNAGLDPWVRAAGSILKPAGRLIAIFRADGLTELVSALEGRFGDIAVLPVHPRGYARAHRILVRAVKGKRGRLSILPGLVLHETAGGAYLPAAEAILRHGRSLADAHPAWAG